MTSISVSRPAITRRNAPDFGFRGVSWYQSGIFLGTRDTKKYVPPGYFLKPGIPTNTFRRGISEYPGYQGVRFAGCALSGARWPPRSQKFIRSSVGSRNPKPQTTHPKPYTYTPNSQTSNPYARISGRDCGWNAQNWTPFVP